MNILLTGSGGFLGGHLFNSINKNHNVYRAVHSKNRYSCLEDKSRVFLINKKNIKEFFKNNKVDLIINAGNSYGRGKTLTSKVYNSNFFIPLLILEESLNYNVKSFIYFDTFFNNGNEFNNYMQSYVYSKKHFSEMVRIFQNKLRIFQLKIFHMYGFGDGKEKFVPWFIQQLFNKTENIKLSDGYQKRDFVNVLDVVNVVIQIINKIDNYENGQYYYEVGTGNLTSVRDLCLMIKKSVEQKLIFDKFPNLLFGAIKENGDPLLEYSANLNYLLDSKLIPPQISLEDGVKELIENYARQ